MTTVDYAYDDKATRRRRQDAAWWVDGSGSAWVATVYDGDRHVHVRADGDMSLHLWDTRKDMLAGCDSDHHVRTANELIEAGIMTDGQLLKADDRMEWTHNAWFDLYDGETGEWLNDVQHTLDDAVNAAIAHLRETVTA